MKLYISFGAFAPTIEEQINSMKMKILNKKEIKFCQELAHAITLLRVQCILTELEVERARKKLMKQIAKAVLV
jgi:hypothetical protein